MQRYAPTRGLIWVGGSVGEERACMKKKELDDEGKVLVALKLL
jgi:hypothetical protein